MFSWLSLAVALLKLANGILQWYQRETLMEEGYQKAVAEEAQKTLRMTTAGRAIMEKVDAMDQATVDAGLRGLEPPATG